MDGSRCFFCLMKHSYVKRERRCLFKFDDRGVGGVDESLI